MAEVKNSDLLDDLIEYAENLTEDQKKTVTAERYLVAVIDFVTEAKESELGEEGRAMKTLLSSKIRDLSSVRAYAMEYLETLRLPSYMDALYFQKHMFEAREAAQKKKSDCLTADALLESIFRDPNENIAGFLLKARRAAEGGVDDIEEIGDTGETGVEGIPVEDISKAIFDGDTDSAGGAEDDKKPDEEPEEDPKTAVAKLTRRVTGIQDALLSSVFGQDNAVSVFTAGYFQAELLALTDVNRKRPRATFLFAGPPGVGKTFLAEEAAALLGLPFMRFDMSEYSNKEADIEFCGADNVYKNAKEGNVTSFVAKHPHCVVLFDEIEKAHLNVIHLFLQMLDAGRLRDNFTDKEVSFKDAIIIFTTNAGKQLYESAETTDLSGVTRKVILKALQNDVNPATGTPYFPAAICSRFASGNVVMFNHITAHNLCEIARREVKRHASNFEKEIGIKVDIDEKVYTALLFAEGGAADARTVRSRAEAFFDDELFELFRLLESRKSNAGVEKLEKIDIRVELPRENKELYGLFEKQDTQEVLVFSSRPVYEQCVQKEPGTRFLYAGTVEDAKKALRENGVSYLLIDPTYGQRGELKYLNIEDVESDARDFFWYMRGAHSDVPIYLLQLQEKELAYEEQLSFLRQGVRGVITLTKGREGFAKEIEAVNEKLHQQRSMETLAKANKLVTFETAQRIKNKGQTAEIKLFDFEMTVAIEAEDSKNILSSISRPDVRFDQVIGAEDAKKELRYFVEYLKDPKKYMGTGVSAPKGVLLYGPPGTGKTMLAKAMASESDVTFITAEGNQFLKKFVGEGPDKVHELFRTARKYAPAILFVDEIDAIAKERRGGELSGGTEATLTAFLTEMDGFKTDTARPVFVLAATNFDIEPGGEKSLDPALLRRFDRRVYIDLPTRDERVRYIRGKLSERAAFELSEDKIASIAVRSTGMSLAELESVIELSLRTAIRDGNLKVTDAVFEEAFETFIGGEVKSWAPSQLERVARHEAGHAFLCWQSGETPSYVTVVARGNHGGYMQHGDNEGKAIYTKDELLSRIRTSLGGRAAELVYYGEREGLSTGASGDLASATEMARQLICSYGMDETIGLAVIGPQEAATGELAGEVRRAVNAILSEEMGKAARLIEENRASIDKLVERLLSENHLTGEEIAEVFQESKNGDPNL